MSIAILNMILPILITFLIGVLSRKINLIDDAGCQTIKNVVCKILLPVIIFNAFLFADYSASSLFTMFVVFCAMFLAFASGHIFRKGTPKQAKYMPFLFSTLEGGTIGYPLVAMLYGTSGTPAFAIMDIGNAIFLYLVIVPLLQKIEGKASSVKDSVKNLFRSPIFDAMILGIVFGVFGFDKVLEKSTAYEIYVPLVSFLTAPTGMLILLTLGHDLSLKKDLLFPVFYTSIMRLVVMAALCAASVFIISLFGTIEKSKLVTLMLAFSLPTSYGLSMFANFDDHKEYISTTISFSTILTLLIFVGISVYAM